MKWHVTIETKTRWSVTRIFEDHLKPSKPQIIRDLHEAFPQMRDALRTELIQRVNAGQFVAVPETAFVVMS